MYILATNSQWQCASHVPFTNVLYTFSHIRAIFSSDVEHTQHTEQISQTEHWIKRWCDNEFLVSKSESVDTSLNAQCMEWTVVIVSVCACVMCIMDDSLSLSLYLCVSVSGNVHHTRLYMCTTMRRGPVQWNIQYHWNGKWLMQLLVSNFVSLEKFDIYWVIVPSKYSARANTILFLYFLFSLALFPCVALSLLLYFVFWSYF